MKNMEKIEVVKSKPIEIAVEVSEELSGRLFKHLDTGKIVLEIYVDGTLLNDEVINEVAKRSGKAWMDWANKQFEGFDENKH